MKLPELGVGIVWSSALSPLLEDDTALATMVEVEPQTLWTATDDGYRVRRGAIERLAALPQRVLVHGVGFPLGGACDPDPIAVDLLRRFIEDLEAPWASEHLGFNTVRRGDDTSCAGWMLPLRQSTEGVDRAANAIRRLAADLPVPFAVETGVSYLKPRPDEIPDGSFVAAIADAADCGILLDLHNLHVNETNGRQPALEFISELPLERVWEIHVAAGMELNGYLLDSHSGFLDEPLLELARVAVPLLPNLRAITFELETEMIGRLGLEGVAAQLVSLGEIWQLRDLGGAGPHHPHPLPTRIESAPPPGPSPDEWEATLGNLLTGRLATSDLERQLQADPGLGLTRQLSLEARAGMCIGTMPLTCQLIVVNLGKAGLWSLMEEHWGTTDPELFATREAEGFAAFLAERRPAIQYLDEVLSYEAALLTAQRTGQTQSTWFVHDPLELLGALRDGRLPDPEEREPMQIPVPPLEPTG